MKRIIDSLPPVGLPMIWPINAHAMNHIEPMNKTVGLIWVLSLHHIGGISFELVEKRLTDEKYLDRNHDPQQSALSVVGLLQMIAAAAATTISCSDAW